MGEYINKGGNEYKIGTCENLYYTTFQEFTRLMKTGELGPEAKEFVNGEFRFRFAFSDENH